MSADLTAGAAAAMPPAAGTFERPFALAWLVDAYD